MSIWKSIIDAGAPKQNPAVSSDKVRVQNTFALASIVLGTPLIFVFYFLGRWEISMVFLGTTLVLWLSLYLNKIGKQISSKFVIIGIYSAILPVYSFLIGFESGFYLYFAIAPALLLSIFEIQYRQKVIIGLVIAGMSLAITLILGYIHGQPYTDMKPSWVSGIYWMNFIFNILILLVLTLQLVMYHYYSIVFVKKMNDELLEKQDLIKRSLQEKEVLLAEIHHRVKNNLAVMSGLMNLQSRQCTSDETKEILGKNAERIHSMALIHNNLYLKDNLYKIEFFHFIEDLVGEIKKSYTSNENNIEFYTELKPISLNVNQAIPCGLIINEILINAIKYAFVSEQKGKIHIQMTRDENKVMIKISDNGIGFDSEKTNDSLGISLIHSLTEQLDGNIALTSNKEKGTQWVLTF